MSAINKNYLGNADLCPYAFPALGGPGWLPITVMVTSEFDDLRPSPDTFAGQLRAAGVDMAMCCEPGVIHEHLNIPGLPANELTLSFLADALKWSREVA